MKYPLSIQNLISHFSQLPTVGPKTAERYVFYLLKQDPETLQKFALALSELKEKTTICQNCLAIAESDPCSICADDKRNKSTICVVDGSRDMMAIESIEKYNGLYHILGGVINAIEGIKEDQLNIKQLIEKIKKNNITEIILALNPDMEGETTAMYLTKLLKEYNIKITRLAKGLPMGANLEYADEITLANALKYRNEL
ncbi:recombination mediator RecR [Patescibacteria group bacterium]|nr:recombination protein RecR [Candidatus Falkowbacteria bacterium]MBU3905873.1 recombination mediator RecR [Patescibacteria group bacterium]MBU4015758.1 recombination mediator RecR [Patescibacteria group bacterium]MBU4026987.1 recombination mediator RecR [Patescibacteria group bacterium]MBU4072772.1 recombination mediator RecR [Patescibacteria group bacterium]